MSTDSSVPIHSEPDGVPDYEDELVREARAGDVSEAGAMHGMVGAAMVGLLGGGPRLAFRAARVVLADSYGSRPAAGKGRLRGRLRRRGE
jgi:hypothetical protein